MYVLGCGYGLKLEGFVLSEGHIILHGFIRVPIAIDVFGHPRAHACRTVVEAGLRNGIIGASITCIEYDVVMSLIVKTSVACIHTMRARLLQSWVVDINVGRIAIVDSAKLVVDAGRIFCKTIVCFYFRANFLSIVLVSELYSRSKLTDGS